MKVKQVGQNFLQVFDRKFLALSVVFFILPSIFAMIHEEWKLQIQLKQLFIYVFTICK